MHRALQEPPVVRAHPQTRALAALLGDKKFGPEAARWLAAMGAEGRAVAAARPVAFALEMHRDRLIVGVGGALVASTFDGLPLSPGPVRVRCEGAEVTSLVAYEKHARTLGGCLR